MHVLVTVYLANGATSVRDYIGLCAVPNSSNSPFLPRTVSRRNLKRTLKFGLSRVCFDESCLQNIEIRTTSGG